MSNNQELKEYDLDLKNWRTNKPYTDGSRRKTIRALDINKAVQSYQIWLWQNDKYDSEHFDLALIINRTNSEKPQAIPSLF